MRISDEESKKRIHYRHEFAIRSKRYEELKKETAELENIRRKPNYVENVVVDKRYFRILAELFVYDASSADLSTIQVKHGNEWLGLGYKELPPELEEFSNIYAVDKREKTIITKIHLDRKKEDIIKDVKFLLKSLDKEAKSHKLDLKTKRPQWDVYDKYIEVFDLKTNNPKLTWGKIAEKLFPQHFKEPHTLKETDPDQNPESAIKLVKHYYKMAQEMVNGGWSGI